MWKLQICNIYKQPLAAETRAWVIPWQLLLMAVEYLHTTPQGTLTLVIGLNSLALESVLPKTMCISSRLNSHKKKEHILLLFF